MNTKQQDTTNQDCPIQYFIDSTYVDQESVIDIVEKRLDNHPMLPFFPHLNNGLDFMLASWRIIWKSTINSLKGVFTTGELMIIIEVHNSSSLSPMDYNSNHLIGAISEAIDSEWLDKKWKVDTKLFFERLEKLSPIQCLCFAIWGAGYWNDQRQEKDHIKYCEQLAIK